MVKKSKKKEVRINKEVDEINKKLSNQLITSSLKENINNFKNFFKDDDILIIREFQSNNKPSISFCLMYYDGLVNSKLINEDIIYPLLKLDNLGDDAIFKLSSQILIIDEIKKTKKVKDVIEDVTYGDAVLLIDGVEEALILNSKNFQTRSITEPESEKVMLGPHEGFNESITTNISLIRRRLRTNDLKLKTLKLGRKSKTKVCICYMDSIVDKAKLNELNKRLKKIDIDAIIDSNYITELTSDKRRTPFRTVGYTERPDVVVGKILEGRMAILVDGSPVALTLPYLFIENFQSGEDYYMDPFYTSFARILRIMGFIFSISVPAFYIAIVAFHQEMMPTPLFISIAFERQSVPLPAALEIFILLIVFDLLKEAGARMPNSIAQALSIVGALVIGQSAVEAKLIAAPMVIVVSFTGITSLLTPKINPATIMIRFSLLFLASNLGLFGFFIGYSLFLIHILNLTSLNTPQLSFTGIFKVQKIKDIFIRLPWYKMKRRPSLITNNKTRMKAR